MSPFYRNFMSNGQSRQQPINDLRETLADACEHFFVGIRDLPKSRRREILIRELKRLAADYQTQPERSGR